MHVVADAIDKRRRIPFLAHRRRNRDGDLKAARCDAHCCSPRATRWNRTFYKGRLAARHGIDAIVPDDVGRTTVHDIIYNELVHGVVSPESQRRAISTWWSVARRDGADSVIFGCTEIGMLLSQGDIVDPVFDTAVLHAKAAVDFALAAAH